MASLTTSSQVRGSAPGALAAAAARFRHTGPASRSHELATWVDGVEPTCRATFPHPSVPSLHPAAALIGQTPALCGGFEARNWELARELAAAQQVANQNSQQLQQAWLHGNATMQQAWLHGNTTLKQAWLHGNETAEQLKQVLNATAEQLLSAWERGNKTERQLEAAVNAAARAEGSTYCTAGPSPEGGTAASSPRGAADQQAIASGGTASSITGSRQVAGGAVIDAVASQTSDQQAGGSAEGGSAGSPAADAGPERNGTAIEKAWLRSKVSLSVYRSAWVRGLRAAAGSRASVRVMDVRHSRCARRWRPHH